MLVSDSELRQSLRSNYLRRLPDLQRLSSRLQRRNASLQDCYRVYQAVGVLPELVEALDTSTAVQQRPELCAELFSNPIKVCNTSLCYHELSVYVHSYRKISNTIRTIFTKNRGPEAGVRIIHLN